MKAESKRESRLLREGEELSPSGKHRKHRNRVKGRTDRARRAHGKKIVRKALREDDAGAP